MVSATVMWGYICLVEVAYSEAFITAHPLAVALAISSVAAGICFAVYHLFKKEHGISLSGVAYVGMMLLIGVSSKGMESLTVAALFVDIGIAGIVAFGFYGAAEQWKEQGKVATHIKTESN